MRLVTRFLVNRTAAAAAEMALILPMLIALMFGGFEAGYYFYNAHKVTKAVRDGARYAGRMRFAAYDCTSASGFASPAAEVKSGLTVEQAIRNITRTDTISGSGAPYVPGWANSGVVITVTCSDTASDVGANTFDPRTGLFVDQPKVISVRVAANTSYRPLFSQLGFSTASVGLASSSQATVMGL